VNPVVQLSQYVSLLKREVGRFSKAVKQLSNCLHLDLSKLAENPSSHNSQAVAEEQYMQFSISHSLHCAKVSSK